MLFDRRSDEAFRDQGVAANVPLWLETDPRVRFADSANVGVVLAVKRSCGDRMPVSKLSILRPSDMRFRV